MAYGRPGIYISERLLPPTLPSGVTANAAGAVVAPFAQGPESVTLVQSWYEFTKYFGGYNAAYPATFQVAAYFNNGGRELYVKRLLAADASQAYVEAVTAGSAVVARFTAKNAGSDGTLLRIVLSAGTVSSTYTVSVYKESGVLNDISDDILLERYENVVFDDSTSSDFAETVINTVSPNIIVSLSASGVPVMTNPYPLTMHGTVVNSGNGSAVVYTDYTLYKGGSVSVFEDFSSLDRPLVLFLPAVQSLASHTVDVYNAATAWAETNNGFVIVETAKAQTSAQAITYAGSLQDTSYAAVYYPWTYISDPIGRGTGATRLIGPSGAVAGLYLHTDTTRGVFKAPAGIGTTVAGIVAIEKSFTSAELDAMNSGSAPVNPLRQIPGAGLAVMGARTLLQDGTANKYVNMRRSLIYIRKQLKNLSQFAIFENNDEVLWAKLRTAINIFLNEYKNQGGLRGATPAQAYFILCDGTNNTAQSIANGEVHIQVGVALQYPAEFIVIDLSQKTIA
jgi:hypothetical protein